MPQIRARVAATDGTVARLVERPLVLHPLRVFDVQLAARRERLPGAAVASWQHTVKHIDAACDRLDQIFGSADAHQITRRFWRHTWRDVVDDLKHDGLLFADAQAADRVAVEADLDGLLEAAAPQIEMARALNDAKQCLSSAESAIFRRIETTRISAFVLKPIECHSRASRPARG